MALAIVSATFCALKNTLSFILTLSMESQQETRNANPLTFDDIGIPTGPKLEEGALGKVGKDWCFFRHYSFLCTG